MAKVKLDPYLFFKGNCREAMEFYKSIFGRNSPKMAAKKVSAADTPVVVALPETIRLPSAVVLAVVEPNEPSPGKDHTLGNEVKKSERHTPRMAKHPSVSRFTPFANVDVAEEIVVVARPFLLTVEVETKVFPQILRVDEPSSSIPLSLMGMIVLL